MTVAAIFNSAPSRMIGMKYVIRYYRFVIAEKQRRIGRGMRYALGRSTLMDGYDLKRAGEALTGIYGLEEISVDGLVASASCRWKDFPELEALADDAAAHVAYRWNSTGDVVAAAEDWAMNLIAEHAAERGIQIEEIDE